MLGPKSLESEEQEISDVMQMAFGRQVFHIMDSVCSFKLFLVMKLMQSCRLLYNGPPTILTVRKNRSMPISSNAVSKAASSEPYLRQ